MNRNFKASQIKAVIGLGNPTPELSVTYHNAGRLFANYLAGGRPLERAGKKFFRFTTTDRIVIAESLTFMNESGRAVSDLIKWFNLKPEEIMVAHDDYDILIGKYKISFGASSAGHKGVESVISHLKTKGFWRLRIGVFHSQGNQTRVKAETVVLNKIKEEHRQKLETVFENIKNDLLLP